MDTAIYDLKINTYSTYERVFNFEGIDLTAYTADFVIRDSQAGTSTILALDETNGLTLAANGDLTLSIASSTTSTLTSDKKWFYLELHTGTNTQRPLQGDVYINAR